MGEPPWRVGELDLTASDAVLRDRLFHYVAFTPLANTTGLPAVSLPLHWSAEGLPIGVQFIAPYGGRIAARPRRALERARPWSGRRPPVG
jgi:Asp-tRNA(Asn)/Glu-tRNA(Gln) amidotransferase A subunit family amidase